MPIRPFQPDDTAPIADLVRATGVFRPEEVGVAIELMEIAAKNPAQRDYIIRTYVDDAGTIQGYYCVGPTPMTVSTFDLYWIAVHPNMHGKGVGPALLRHAEELMRSMGGSLVVVHTSSTPKYDATRRFYVKNRYDESCRLRGYYAPGDDLVIYSKHIQEG